MNFRVQNMSWDYLFVTWDLYNNSVDNSRTEYYVVKVYTALSVYVREEKHFTYGDQNAPVMLISNLMQQEKYTLRLYAFSTGGESEANVIEATTEEIGTNLCISNCKTIFTELNIGFIYCAKHI